jgi:hypothetical protein
MPEIPSLPCVQDRSNVNPKQLPTYPAASYSGARQKPATSSWGISWIGQVIPRWMWRTGLHCFIVILWCDRRGAEPAHVHILANATQCKESSPAQQSRGSNREWESEDPGFKQAVPSRFSAEMRRRRGFWVVLDESWRRMAKLQQLIEWGRRSVGEESFWVVT